MQSVTLLPWHRRTWMSFRPAPAQMPLPRAEACGAYVCICMCELGGGQLRSVCVREFTGLCFIAYIMYTLSTFIGLNGQRAKLC